MLKIGWEERILQCRHIINIALGKQEVLLHWRARATEGILESSTQKNDTITGTKNLKLFQKLLFHVIGLHVIV